MSLDPSWINPYRRQVMNLISAARFGPRFPILVLIVVMFSWAGNASARSPISLDVLQRDGYGSVELIKGGANRLFVPAEINGKKIRLLLDTGWGTEGITLGVNPSEFQVAPEKGVNMLLSAGGAHTRTGHGTAKSIVMGNVQIQGTPVYFGPFREAGFLGRGFLKRNHAVIDLTNLRLYLRPPGKGRSVDLAPALSALGLARAPFFEEHGSFVLNVEVNGVPTQMALDTGAQLTALDVRFAKVARAGGWGRRNMHFVDAVGTMTPADFAGTKTFKIEGVPIRTPPTLVLTTFAGYDLTHGKMTGLLGLDAIGMNWGIIDVGQQKFYFTRAN